MRRSPTLLLYAAVVVLVAVIVCMPVAAELSAGDSLLTRDYVEKTVKPALIELVEDRAEAGFAADNALIQEMGRIYAAFSARLDKKSLASHMAELAFDKLRASQSSYIQTTGTRITLQAGDVVSGSMGTSITLYSGAGTIGGSGSVVNVSTGAELSSGTAALYNRYILTEKAGATFKATAADTVVFVAGAYKITRADAYTQENVDMAFALRQMHLMSGTPDGLKLVKPLTRGEALIFMLNFLGLAEEASVCTLDMPFKDVPDWLRPYAAFAYERKLIAGTSATTYKPDDNITPDDFCALLLRTLGYSDTGGKDFIWKHSIDKAVELGIYTDKERTYFRSGSFVRDKAVYALYYMLDGVRKDGKTTLAFLIEAGVMTAEEAASARDGISRVR